MQAVQVVGRFVTESKKPVEGKIRFIPSRIWVDHEGETYPTMAWDGDLVSGSFLVYLTRTDTGLVPWHYTVETPVGTWQVEITQDGPIMLSTLLPKDRFA